MLNIYGIMQIHLKIFNLVNIWRQTKCIFSNYMELNLINVHKYIFNTYGKICKNIRMIRKINADYLWHIANTF